MSISNLTLLTAPTIAVTGGTTQTFAPNGTKVTRGVSVADVAATSILDQDTCVFKNTQGTLQSDGSFSKDRREAKYVHPYVFPDGSLDYAYIEVRLVRNPSRPATEVPLLKEKAVQLINDADLSNFWTNGSVV